MSVRGVLLLMTTSVLPPLQRRAPLSFALFGKILVASRSDKLQLIRLALQ